MHENCGGVFSMFKTLETNVICSQTKKKKKLTDMHLFCVGVEWARERVCVCVCVCVYV